ncbi:uncharacterized protein LOC131243307 [Magnolia sinica]|uniref:uncharacterized protein LOC131243307 n=1 Tax=Magnolia sinica TaxID=86752 RepID=UPI00265B720D|nr:uncharacterized protein LOC131243307 [Magnolia sinica]XP_058098533.1 uncharacterized protein LOC131243307 [Magnolia sinica]
MYRMKSPSDRRPPLAESPQLPRARRVLCSNGTIQSPPASLTKTQVPNCSWNLEGSRIRPEFQSVSCDLRALAKMVEDELGHNILPTAFMATNTHSSPLFERGRLYNEYSARRNERLKRKKMEAEEEKTSAVHDTGVLAVECGKRRNAKKTETVRKSVPANFSVGRREGLRSSTRISKETKKPIASRNVSERSAVNGINKTIGTRAVRRS